MIWLFDSGKNYQDLLQGSVAESIRTAYLKDRARKTKKGRRSKKRDHLRQFCREALVAISPEDPSTHPVMLERLSFKIFSRWLSTFKKKVTKRKAVQPADDEETVVVAIKESALIRLSSSSYDGACSALSHLFTESGTEKEKNKNTADVWAKLSSFKKGTRRLAVKENLKHGLSL